MKYPPTASAIDRAAILLSPLEDPCRKRDPDYDQFEGLCLVYPDGRKPTQEELLAVDESLIDTPTLWDRHGEALGYDYLARESIMRSFARDWDNLTEEDQKVCARYPVVGPDAQLKFYPPEELSSFGLENDVLATEARISRYEAGKFLLMQSLYPLDAQSIAGAILSQGLRALYVEGGIKGTLWGNSEPGLLDYLNATPATSFEHTGMRRQKMTPRSGTLDELCDRMINVAVEGLA